MRMRKVYKKISNEWWVRVKMKELKKGDTFKMFEDNDEPVTDCLNRTEWTADTDAVEMNGVWGIGVRK